MIFGVDVSSHQGAVDWAKVKAAGFSFAINRACLDTKPDATWPRNTAGARAAGLIPGAYHFLYPSANGPAAQPAAAQCDAFLGVVGNPTGLIVVLDVESDNGGADQPTFADVREWVARFHHFWPTHPVLIYTGAWYWNSLSHPIHNANAAALGPLWDSRYVAASSPRTAAHLFASVPTSWWTPGFGGWSRVTILQFSSSAIVPGVLGNCDVSAFRGTEADLRALTGPPPPAPVPTPQPPEVDMILAHYRPGSTITVKPTANIRADAKLSAQVYRHLAAEEPWVIIGDVVGDVDPEGGSNVWYVRWGFNRWEYTAKSNVTAGPTAPVDAKLAVEAFRERARTAAILAVGKSIDAS